MMWIERAQRWIETVADPGDAVQASRMEPAAGGQVLRRASVTEVLRPLQEAGLIRSQRGFSQLGSAISRTS